MNKTELALYPQSLPEMSQNLPFPSYQCWYPENLIAWEGSGIFHQQLVGEVSFNLHVYNIKIVSLLLCTKGFKYHFSDTNSNYQHVVNSFKYIPKQWIGLKMCSDWLLKLQNPLLSTSEQLIWVCAQKYCNRWRNEWVKIIFWALLSNCCSLYPIQTRFFSKHLFTSMSVTVSVDIYHAAVQLG